MPTTQPSGFQVPGNNAKALFTLKIHRGDGMCLLAMNWKKGQPPKDFVGFGIEYKEPGGQKFFALKNRLTFAGADPNDSNRLLSLRSPFQKFRWVHFPRNANMDGEFVYRVTPVFMNAQDELSNGEPQEASLELRRDTYPGKVNVAYTRGFVSSQAFVDYYQKDGEDISMLMPPDAKKGLTFTPTHSKKDEAYKWMGFEAREIILELLDSAIKDKKANVSVIAYDLNEPEIVSRLEQIGDRLRIIIDEDGPHGETDSGENQAATRLRKTAGKSNVKRQHMGKLQHNKVIIVDGTKIKTVVCGSTNFSWRGVYVQANNALEIQGAKALKVFSDAFENYWNNKNVVKDFGATPSAGWNDLTIFGIDMKVAFSPHVSSNAMLQSIADDLDKNIKSSLFYSLAFLHQTPGVINTAINKATNNPAIFVYGISDKKNGGIVLQKTDGNLVPVSPKELTDKNTPEPFKSEPVGGGGARMHHKFIVVDFDKPTARVYMGSYNFSKAADTSNGENLLLIKDQRIAVSYMIEALRIFDHYDFRIKQNNAATAVKKLELKKPARQAGETAWWEEYYTDNHRIQDRKLFA
jgi:phosphatidylserine/phosphatidylglycerophosphate/cardiolipin synthase-like enzyme